MSKEEAFDFLSEISSSEVYYRLLIPERDIGIIIFSICQALDKSYDNIITEDNLIELIIKVKGYDQRIQHTEIVNIIRELNEFFLKKVVNGYRLTDYAKKFHEIIYIKVECDFKPSEVEERFLKLNKKLYNTNSEFAEWYEDIFKSNSHQLEAQLESFEIQIKNTFKKFREAITSESTTGLMQLKEIHENISQLEQQNKELKTIFRVTDEIKAKLISIDVDSHNQINRKKAIDFFSQLTLDFRRISERTDRLSTKIYIFLENLDRADFEKNIRKLLLYTLENASNIGGKVILPQDLVKKRLFLKQKTSFVDTTKVRMDDQLEQKIYKPKQDYSKEHRIASVKKKDQDDQLITDIYNKIKLILMREKTLNSCVPYFQSILDKTNSLSAVIKLVHLLMKQFATSKKYKVYIKKGQLLSNEKIIINDLKITEIDER